MTQDEMRECVLLPKLVAAVDRLRQEFDNAEAEYDYLRRVRAVRAVHREATRLLHTYADASAEGAGQ